MDSQAKKLDIYSGFPTCVASVTETTAKYRAIAHRRNVQVCGMTASYEVAGKVYCKKHAEVMALKILMGESDGK